MKVTVGHLGVTRVVASESPRLAVVAALICMCGTVANKLSAVAISRGYDSAYGGAAESFLFLILYVG